MGKEAIEVLRAQITVEPGVHRNMRRILAIDGGGLRGVVPAAFLAAVEDEIRDRAGNYFDLIAGTSTGGLIALGLGLGFSAGEILRLYETWGPAVFPRKKRRRLSLRGLTSPLYDLEALGRAVQTVWGSRRLKDSRCRLLIPAYDLKGGKVHVWRTPHTPGCEPGDDGDALEVALSTSAAPVYFQPYRRDGVALVDGGIWANCPVLLAVTEAVGVLGWKPEETYVLSLGCSLPPLREGDGRPFNGGLLQWGPHLPQLFLGAQDAGALEMARLVLGEDRLVRVSPPDPTGSLAVDNPADIPRFVEMGKRAALHQLPALRERFFRQQAEPFVPGARSTGGRQK